MWKLADLFSAWKKNLVVMRELVSIITNGLDSWVSPLSSLSKLLSSTKYKLIMLNERNYMSIELLCFMGGVMAGHLSWWIITGLINKGNK